MSASDESSTNVLPHVRDSLLVRAARLTVVRGPDAGLERRFASPNISDPRIFDWNDSTTWISHVTGAAIDLTLRRIGSGEHLYMGGIFDDPSDNSTTDHYEGVSIALGMSAHEARCNRRLLYWSMLREGFSGLPSEWWHYDFGDQLWAKNRPRVFADEAGITAFYGPMPPPE